MHSTAIIAVERGEGRTDHCMRSLIILLYRITSTAPITCHSCFHGRERPGQQTERLEAIEDERRSRIADAVKALDIELDHDEQEKLVGCLVRSLRSVDWSDPEQKKTAADRMRGVVDYAMSDSKTAAGAMRGGLDCAMSENVLEKIHLSTLINSVLNALGLEVESQTEKTLDDFMGIRTAQTAFETDYVIHGGEAAFLKHLEVQKNLYQNDPSQKYPFFSIIQSSGYGKSRLMTQLQVAPTEGAPRIIYLSFAATGAFPASNVLIHGIEVQGRIVVEMAFEQLFEEAALASPQEEKFYLRKASSGTNVSENVNAGENVLFVLDEVSQLLSKRATENVDFFRCLRKATKEYMAKHPGSFFVLLSTYSSVNQLMPERCFDPSSKFFLGRDQEVLEPMAPFLLHHALAVRNSQTEILSKNVTDCHSFKTLLAMGRPMWHAFLSTPSARKSASAEERLLGFALAKLLQQSPPPSHHKLTSQQMLALLACRACLTIAPVSRFAPAMVACHMATAVSISTAGDEVVVAYPSEPILALASRSYSKMQNKEAFMQRLVVQLKDYFASGTVAEGHRGEVIVRLLNLLAIDECMSTIADYHVEEICLGDFLAQFDREGANLSNHLKGANGNVELTERQRKMLKREGISETAITDGVEGFPLALLENGKVCFTHFIYLSVDAMITPDLLRYAYRRTAAIVFNAGRRGIDWIIPVRVGDDEFVGLSGQDKNRMRDTLAALSALSNDTTHRKVSAAYFLNPGERKMFEDIGWSLRWPAILFSIGAEEAGAALAEQATRMRLRGTDVGDTEDKFQFPCIVLTGLGYSKLMDDATDGALRQLRDFVIEVPSVYKDRVPLTYGVSNSTAANDSPAVADEMDCS